MDALIYAFLYTIELWAFLGLLLTYMVFEAIITKLKQRSTK